MNSKKTFEKHWLFELFEIIWNASLAFAVGYMVAGLTIPNNDYILAAIIITIFGSVFKGINIFNISNQKNKMKLIESLRIN